MLARLGLGRQLYSNCIRSTPTRVTRFLPAQTVRWQSTAHDGPAVSETNRAEATMKRFWKEVGVEKRGGNLVVTLDKRALKTPSGHTLFLPENKTLLATLIAVEWDSQETLLKPYALPMSSLASRAVDALNDENTRAEVRAALLKYLDTDTICFFQDDPPQLVDLQAKHWDPLINWVQDKYNVKVIKSESILSFSQPQETKEKLDKAMASFDHWQMAAMERITYTTKSFIIALALVTKHITVEQAALAASVEVDSQIERWGEVEDTHDVDYHDIRRQLGSAACLLSTL